jgi:hypothetical protein
MSIRLASYVIIPVVFLAGGWALHGADRAPDVVLATPQATSPALTMGEVLPSGDGETLPPNHPPIGGAGAPHGSMPSAAADPPALTWKIPEGWQEAPSPNAMRLATYKVPGGVEVSISRAGGATEANIQRWVGQFDNVGREVHAEKTVHGVRDGAPTSAEHWMAASAPASKQMPLWHCHVCWQALPAGPRLWHCPVDSSLATAQYAPEAQLQPQVEPPGSSLQ